jgi:hypothetical protein
MAMENPGEIEFFEFFCFFFTAAKHSDCAQATKRLLKCVEKLYWAG